MAAPHLDSDFLAVDVFNHYMTLPQPSNKIQAEYFWIGGSGSDIRCKTKTLDLEEVKSLKDLPIWNYDGSSTGQAPGKDSEVYLKPVQFYPDPFRRGKNILCFARHVFRMGSSPQFLLTLVTPVLKLWSMQELMYRGSELSKNSR